MKRYYLVLIAFVLTLTLPYLGSYLRFGSAPPGYGYFPAILVQPPPGYNTIYFTLACSIAVVITIFLLFPRLFGFKKSVSTSSPTTPIVGYPSWFKPGIILMLVSWFFMWGPISIVEPFDHFSFVPLWWGFILVLDGLVYSRNNGRSLISARPNTMKLLSVVSSVSWFVFEYLNFFVLENWYYPNDQIFTNFGNISWQLASYTTVLPAVFEWYSLLKTFPKIKERYAQGPIIKTNDTILYFLLFLGCCSMVAMGYWPYPLFFLLWLSLIPILVPAMTIGKYWTPFAEISKNGNWSSLILIAIATLLNGFFWEFWNYGSEWFHQGSPTNPNYWKYSVPYVDVGHFFSEMPILGYFGYLFFGIVCWIMWLTMAYLFKFDPDVEIN